jgi:hypothetical protein
MRDYFGNLEQMGFEQLTSLAASIGLTTPKGPMFGTAPELSKSVARLAIIQAEGANVRWRDDGTAPTAGIGMRLLQDRDMFYQGDLSAIRFIQEAGGAKLNVAYYK